MDLTLCTSTGTRACRLLVGLLSQTLAGLVTAPEGLDHKSKAPPSSGARPVSATLVRICLSGDGLFLLVGRVHALFGLLIEYFPVPQPPGPPLAAPFFFAFFSLSCATTGVDTANRRCGCEKGQHQHQSEFTHFDSPPDPVETPRLPAYRSFGGGQRREESSGWRQQRRRGSREYGIARASHGHVNVLLTLPGARSRHSGIRPGRMELPFQRHTSAPDGGFVPSGFSSLFLDPEQRLGRCQNTTEPQSCLCAAPSPSHRRYRPPDPRRGRPSGRLEALARDARQEAVERLARVHAQHGMVVAAHAGIGHVAGAARQNPLISRRRMGVGSHHAAHAAVEERTPSPASRSSPPRGNRRRWRRRRASARKPSPRARWRGRGRPSPT